MEGRKSEKILITAPKNMIMHLVRKNTKLRAPKLALSMSSEIGRSVSAETAGCVLHNAGLHGHTPIRKLLIRCVERKKEKKNKEGKKERNTSFCKRPYFKTGTILENCSGL